LTRQMTQKTFAKRYLAVVCGHPGADQAELCDYLVKNEALNVSRVVESTHRQAKRAVLRYTCLERSVDAEGQPLALLAIDLETGRHHQIRVQMAHAGLPLWGDTKYNPARNQKGSWQAIGLLAWQLSFNHPITGRLLAFTAPMPDDFPWSLFAKPELTMLQCIQPAPHTVSRPERM
jgi:23S rRNA pseudouridine1911/1915/1917 synthase